MMDVLTYCELELKKRGHHADPAQQVAIERLQRCYLEWVDYEAGRSHFLKKWRRSAAPKGVYMWGGVGRGKSFLMNAFCACVPVKKRVRLHFHEFMREVHQQLQTLKGHANPLDMLAAKMAQRYRLICFDEFHITDIADAMLLYRLLHALFEEGVQFVMTSNDRPDQLYPDGLHRERMLSAIALIYEKLDVLHVDGGIDYRHLQGAPSVEPHGDIPIDSDSVAAHLPASVEGLQCYHTPLGAQTHAALLDIFARLTGINLQSQNASEAAVILQIEHRKVSALACAPGVVWFDFQVLCGAARSQNDYLDIARRFHTVIVSNLPELNEDQTLAARRFTWLVDVLYDTQTCLILSSAVPLSELYVGPTLIRQCARTMSRVVEMQTKSYLEKAKARALQH